MLAWMRDGVTERFEKIADRTSLGARHDEQSRADQDDEKFWK